MEEKTDLWLPGAEKLAAVVGGAGGCDCGMVSGFPFQVMEAPH